MARRERVWLGLAVLLALAAVAVWLILSQALGSETSVAPAAPAEAGKAEAAPLEPRPDSLDSAFVFSAPADCAMGEPLVSIVSAMVRTDPRTLESARGAPVRVPGLSAPVTPTFEREREIDGNADIRTITADLDLSGLWHGLRVVRLRRQFQEESDYSSVQIQFDEPPERVRDVLNGQGFRLPAVGQGRAVGPDEGFQTHIGVERLERGAALTCST